MGGYTSSKTTGSVFPRLNCALCGKFSTNIIRRYRELCMNKFFVQTRLKTKNAIVFFFAHMFWEGSGVLRNPGEMAREQIGYRTSRFALSLRRNPRSGCRNCGVPMNLL